LPVDNSSLLGAGEQAGISDAAFVWLRET